MENMGEQSLNRIYEDFSKEQMRLMTDIKNGGDLGKDKDIQKQITMLNTITINIIRFRNLRKQIVDKTNF